MKLLTTLFDIKNLDLLSEADGFIIGNETYGTRLTKSFSISEINEIISYGKSHQKDVFLVANQMFDDHMIDTFKTWIKAINIDDLTGLIVADVGLYYALKKEGLEEKVIYNPETLMTNYYDFNFLVETGIYGVFIAKEITLEDIKIISEKKQTKLFMVGHGHLNMFYSKRQLIDNYMHFMDKENHIHNKQTLKIIEEKRSEEPYPILEDLAGTHVFRSQVFDSIDYIETLKPLVDYLVIDSIFKDDAYAKAIIDMYQGHVSLTKEEIENTYEEVWDHGFFFKKTIYKQGA
ncbi:MAG: peptidase U32 family protein [Acholeplasmataceae bacterium]